jgi:hypothetical protein
MTEPTDNLENRLAGLRPRPVTSSLESRIACAASRPEPGPAARGFFWTAVTGGALAACTILVLMIGSATGARGEIAPSRTVAQATRESGTTALALADWRWGDELKIDTQDRRHP